MTCLSEIEVSRFCEGALGEEERARCEAHVRDCSSCRVKVADAMPRALGETGELQAAQTPRPTALPEHPPLQRGSVLGRYVVLDVLGAGGMGEVYAAIDPELDRRVALKLVKDGAGSSGSSSQGQARLLREAQAMARLSHPNVVSVYDVGVVDGRVFLAMELVEGITLKEWMKQRRSWREVLRVFMDAGRGLAAAHETGIVHRDFKPDNILIGKDGRARVLDFGLARAPSDARGMAPLLDDLHEPTEATPNPSKHLLLSPITQTEQVIGTPKYMAPEQFLGKPVDARSDQFSFCVALAEALYGEMPFDGVDLLSRARAVTSGQLRPAPKNSDVPAWVRRIVVRGLSVDPIARFPSMGALLATAASDPSVARGRVMSTAAVLVAVAAAGLIGARISGQRQRLCEGASTRLSGVWDGARRGAIESAFTATKQPFAAAAFSNVAQVLDGWAHDWSAGVTEACEATRIRGEQSEEALDLRMDCFNQRLDEMRALSDLLARAEKKLVEAAPRAASSLASVKSCSELTQLKSRQPLPPEPDKRTTIASVRKQLAQVKALTAAWKYKEALELVKPAADAANALGWRPLQADAMYKLALVEDSLGDYDAAGKDYEAAERAAVAARDDRLVASAWIKLFDLRGQSQAKFEEGEWLAKQAEAALERYGDDLDLKAMYLVQLGNLHYTEGKYEESAADFQKSADAYERSQGPESIDFASALSNLGVPLSVLGRNDEALIHYERALAIQSKKLGANHPVNQMVHNNIASSLMAQSRYQEAHDHNLQALVLAEQAQGPDGDNVALVLGNLANTYIALDKTKEGLEAAQRALDINTRKLGKDHPSTAYSLLAIATAMQAMHRMPESIDYLQQALVVAEKNYPEGHELTVYVLCGLGEVELAQMHGSPAEKWFSKCVKVGEKALGKDSPGLVRAFVGLGGAQQLLKHHRDAISTFEHAQQLVKADQNPHEEVGRLKLRLACSFKAEKEHVDEATTLVADALTEFKTAGPMGKEGLEYAEAISSGKPCPAVAVSGGQQDL